MATETPKPSPHAEAAKVILDKLRALRAEIPRFVPHDRGAARQLAQKAAVPDAALESASVVIQVSPRLEMASGTDAATLRDAFGYALAYEAVVQELHAFMRSMRHTIRVARAEAGASALDVYAIARRFSLQKDGAELRPHVEDMRRKLKKRTRRTVGEPAPAPDSNAATSPVV
jgi:hypothetical protein